MPALTRYYLGEDALLPQVPTYLGFRKPDLAYILDHLDSLVVKTTGDSGGYGMLMGRFAARHEIEAFRHTATQPVARRRSPGDAAGKLDVSWQPHRPGSS